MLLTRTSVRLTLTRPTCTSRLDCSFCRMVRLQQAPPTRVTPQFPRMFTLRLTNLLLFTDLLLRNGVLLSLSSLPKALHPQLLEQLDGTARWPRSVTRAYPLSNSTPMSSVKAFDHLPSTLPRGLPVPGRSHQDRMRSLLAPLPMALVPLVPQAPRHQVLAQCVVECHLHQRPITSHQAHTMHNPCSSPLSRLKRSRSRSLHSISRSRSSSLHAFPTLTTVLMLVAYPLHPLRHQPVCRALHLSLSPRDRCPRTDVPAARHQRCAPLWRTGLAPHAMDTRDLTSTTLILLPVVVLLAVHLLQHLPWLPLSKRHGIAMIAHPLLPNATASGRRMTT
jgi:hypothetical protein